MNVQRDIPNTAVTDWTDKIELFMQYPFLVVGTTARFTVHLTDMRDFQPVTTGRVVINIEGGGSANRFVAERPSSPGIFGVDVLPTKAGTFPVTVRLEGSELSDTFHIDHVTVYPDAEHLSRVVPPTDSVSAEGGITFLKEQQWTLEFGTALVEERQLRPSLLVPAEIIPRTGGSAEVTVPFDGQLVVSSLPAIGSQVTQGQVLAQLLPPTNVPSDLASLELALREASAQLALARRDRQRAERLLAVGAVPAKRLDEARTVEETAEARLDAAEIHLAKYRMSSVASLDARGTELFALRAPIAGTIEQTHAAPGATVEAGEVLFQIVNLDTVYVVAIVPATELPKIGKLSGAELEVPETNERKSLERLISIGRIIDPASRTFPEIYEIDNRDRRLAVNQAVRIQLFNAAAMMSPAVPESAILDDGGRPVVFVQTAGESFLRRPITLGIREGGFVQVLDGVEPGDRIVTRGAYLMRLAALSNQTPAQGHIH
jgi:RND family efflux transporter MFP subunit